METDIEKLIYVLMDGAEDQGSSVERIAEGVVSAARSAGAERLSVLVPDYTNEIRERCAGRLGGAIDRLSSVFECWVPALDSRGAIEEALSPLAGEVWGYMVTESTLAECPHAVGDGERVPGITQWGINDKPKGVALDDFYREWAVHSKLSFDLHPTRQSYIRNAIVRRLTNSAPAYLGIVLERFPRLEDFVDESIYFGDPSVVREMIQHVPAFYDFATAMTGGLSEYRWS